MLSSSDRAAIEDRIHCELCRSFLIHGVWSGLSYHQMVSVIIDELCEVIEALDAEDYVSEHGVYNELAQVAACCQKMMAMVKREKGL